MIVPWARQVPSPHYSSREGWAVDTVVIHHISLPPGRFGGRYIEQFFCSRLDPVVHPFFAEIAALRVSAHFLIDRSGVVTQFVDTDQKAWHAGQSEWEGVSDVNRFSIGIELEGDLVTPYEDLQYESLARLLQDLRTAHPGIALHRLLGHEHVAPGRKSDPGPLFDWGRLRSALDGSVT